MAGWVVGDVVRVWCVGYVFEAGEVSGIVECGGELWDVVVDCSVGVFIDDDVGFYVVLCCVVWVGVVVEGEGFVWVDYSVVDLCCYVVDIFVWCVREIVGGKFWYGVVEGGFFCYFGGVFCWIWFVVCVLGVFVVFDVFIEVF